MQTLECDLARGGLAGGTMQNPNAPLEAQLGSGDLAVPIGCSVLSHHSLLGVH